MFVCFCFSGPHPLSKARDQNCILMDTSWIQGSCIFLNHTKFGVPCGLLDDYEDQAQGSVILVSVFSSRNRIWEFPVAQLVKDLSLPLLRLRSLLWCGFDPWPENFCMLWARPHKKNHTKFVVERQPLLLITLRYLSSQNFCALLCINKYPFELKCFKSKDREHIYIQFYILLFWLIVSVFSC